MKNFTYSRTNWVDNKTPVNAAALNNIETALQTITRDALDVGNVGGGKGITIGSSDENNIIITVDDTVVLSESIVGIEAVTTAIKDKNNILYLVLDWGEGSTAMTPTLSEIVYNGNTLYSFSSIDTVVDRVGVLEVANTTVLSEIDVLNADVALLKEASSEASIVTSDLVAKSSNILEVQLPAVNASIATLTSDMEELSNKLLTVEAAISRIDLALEALTTRVAELEKVTP